MRCRPVIVRMVLLAGLTLGLVGPASPGDPILEPTDVAAGDVVTAECVRERGWLAALTVTLADVVYLEAAM